MSIYTLSLLCLASATQLHPTTTSALSSAQSYGQSRSSCCAQTSADEETLAEAEGWSNSCGCKPLWYKKKCYRPRSCGCSCDCGEPCDVDGDGDFDDDDLCVDLDDPCEFPRHLCPLDDRVWVLE